MDYKLKVFHASHQKVDYFEFIAPFAFIPLYGVIYPSSEIPDLMVFPRHCKLESISPTGVLTPVPFIHYLRTPIYNFRSSTSPTVSTYPDFMDDCDCTDLMLPPGRYRLSYVANESHSKVQYLLVATFPE